VLDPRDRGALLEALRPPPGYVVDSAIATTYSLDLIALLTAPLAFSLYDRLVARDSHGQGGRLDSFALLHAVRKHSERLVVFCQTGCIARPKTYRQLLAYLEDTVVQVKARSDSGVFHPKIWVQRLTSETGPVRYKVLCLSRNLTFDRSWDTMLSLEGELVADRKLAIGESKPLGEFIEALPSLVVEKESFSPARRELVGRIGDELKRVRFDVPAGFDSMRFWPLGHDGKTKTDPFVGDRIDRLLVISPFLAASRLEKLSERGTKHVLVSRIDQLAAIPREVLDGYAEVHVLHDAAEEVDEDSEAREETDAESLGPVPAARGLHAKVYVADDGWNAHLWTGSANATDAAFGPNVEFLVQLTGKKSKLGIDVTLAGEGGTGLRGLLAPFVAPDVPITEPEVDLALARLIREANYAISTASWIAHAERSSMAGEKEMYTVSLSARDGAVGLPAGCSARVWPIALQQDRAVALDSNAKATFERCSFQALTSFFAFEITASIGQRVERCEFVVRVALEGAPEDRSARVLHSLLDDPAKVMRFLRLLLSLDAFEALDLLESESGDAAGASTGPPGIGDAVPLFESLVRTLDRDPERLLEVDRLVRELRATEAGGRLLPAAFDELWVPLWSAYQSLPRTRDGRTA
jgi:hypothetical protein